MAHEPREIGEVVPEREYLIHYRVDGQGLLHVDGAASGAGADETPEFEIGQRAQEHRGAGRREPCSGFAAARESGGDERGAGAPGDGSRRWSPVALADIE